MAAEAEAAAGRTIPWPFLPQQKVKRTSLNIMSGITSANNAAKRTKLDTI